MGLSKRMTPEERKAFMDLFVHRRDVYAIQSQTGAYYPQRQPLTEDDVAGHLAGHESIGTYVIDPTDQTVKYVCFDLDTHDPDQLKQLAFCAEMLMPEQQQDARCLLMEFSGSKGHHVWLFFDKPLPARQVRAWLNTSFWPNWDKSGYPRPEAFPKQDTVDPGMFGNLVKAPLGVHAVTGKKSEIVGYQGWAESVNDVVPLDSSLVPAAVPAKGPAPGRQAGAEPAAPFASHTLPSGAVLTQVSMSPAPSAPFACINQILREGVGSGYRDRAMFHLALYFFGHGLDQDLAEDACLRANESFDPPLTASEVRAKVASAYRGRHVSAKCGVDWLREICPGPCREGWSVRSAEKSALTRAQVGDSVDVEVVATSHERGRHTVRVSHPDASNSPTFVVS